MIYVTHLKQIYSLGLFLYCRGLRRHTHASCSLHPKSLREDKNAAFIVGTNGLTPCNHSYIYLNIMQTFALNSISYIRAARPEKKKPDGLVTMGLRFWGPTPLYREKEVGPLIGTLFVNSELKLENELRRPTVNVDAFAKFRH